MIDTNPLVYIGRIKSNCENLNNKITDSLSFFEDHLLSILKKSDSVILKPNILPTEFRNEGLGVTNPVICASVADFLLDLGFKKIYLAEGTTNNRKGEPDTLEAMKNNGFSEYIDKWEQFDMNKDEIGKWFEIYSPGDEGNPDDPFDIEIGISKLATTYPIVSVAKLKAHDVLGLTLSVKNLMGCLTEARRKSTGQSLFKGPRVKSFLHGFGPRNPYQIEPRELNFTTSKTALAINLSRLAKNIFPSFSVLDAAPAMEGNGPLSGEPNNMNLILCSNDSIALDSVACNLIKIDLEYNQYIKNLGRLNLGVANINKIDIINPEIYNEFLSSGSFKLHKWFKDAKFTEDEIELLIRLTS